MTSPKKIHIVGIGNITRQDDGVAIRIIEQLQSMIVDDEIKITDLGTGGVDIALMLENWEYGLIIDAVKIEGHKPGTISEFILTEDSLPEIKGLSSTHGFDAITSLKLANNLDDFNLPKEIRIIGIQIEVMNDFGTELSQRVESAIPKVIGRIKELIEYYCAK